MGSQHGHKKAGPKKSHKSGPESKYVKMPKLKKAPENPFDKFANSKKKHEVINRRVKGEDRNVGKARKNAIESRKNRLQQDYQSTKKTNSFADKRFGESDADLSLEDKMFLRFQKERVKKARNVSLFNLEGGDDVLTHKGQTIGEGNMADDDWHSDDDDDKGGLGRDVVNSLHFGGGMVATKGSNNNIYGPNNGSEGHGEGDNKAPKNRLDALQEIVAKSKMFKLQKKEAKEEQENDREKLDKDFQALVAGSMLDFRPTRQDRSELKDPNEVMDEYDISLRSMAFEVKARPSDRTKSDEEKAVEARDRLEELEAARLRRMNADSDPSDNAAADKALKNHSDAKKRKRVTDDEVDGSFGSNFAKNDDDDDEEEEEAEEDDEEEGDDEDDDEDDEDDDEDDDDEEDDDEEEEDENEEGDGGNDEEEDDWEEEDAEPVAVKVKTCKAASKKSAKVADDQDEIDMDGDDLEDGSDGEGDDQVDKKGGKRKEEEDDELDEMPERKVKKLKKADRAVELLASEGVNNMMPHKINCPSSAEEFDNMTAKYVRTAADLRELVSRILVWSSVHLPGKEGTENRGRMHNFLDVLLKLFVRVGDSLCADKSNEVEIQGQLDFLCMSIFKLGQDVADASPLLWRRTLKLMQSQLQKRLRDFVQGIRDSCWPSLGQQLLLRLSGHVFAVTDFKHAVIGPASLFLCQCLTQCPVRTSKDVASGLLICSILMSFNEETHRIVPECVEFLRSVVCAFVPPSETLDLRPQFEAVSSLIFITLTTNTAKHAPPQRTFDMESPALKMFRESASKSSQSANKNEKLRIQWGSFNKEKGIPSDLKTGCCARSFLFTAQLLLSDLVATYTNISAFPEMFATVLQVLSAVRPQDKPALPLELQATHVILSESIIRITAERKASRSALQWRKSVKMSIEVKNPKFQADYTFRKDLDPDENRAKLKQLTRQSKRETKAAMRELRRDSDFIDQLSYAEQEAKKDKLKAERVKNFGWMEEQQASINMQVRKGGEMMTGGGSSIARKARVKR